MANPWFRLWSDMVNDPKWRTIARVSKQEVSRVIAVYLHMMTCASNATERGRLQGWCDEDIATALDIETDDVEAIRCAMEDRVLDGDYLTGWQKRQPVREDDSAARSKAWREAQKQDAEQPKTQPNATERIQPLDKIREDKTIKTKPKRDASAFARFWEAYPKKLGKGKAERAFEKIDVALLDSILQSIAAHCKSDQWIKDGGQYIPYPATWLNEKRWEDTLAISVQYKPIVPLITPVDLPKSDPDKARAAIQSARAAFKPRAA